MPTNKSETVVPETAAEGEAKPKRVRKPASPKPSQEGSAPAKKAARRKEPAPAAAQEAAVEVSLSKEDISVRAYFIGEHRRSLGLCGDSEGDWLEAERQLRSEAHGIAASLRAK